MSTKTMNSPKHSDSSAEKHSFMADLNQFSGLILALGILATYGSLAEIATQVGPDGTTSSSGIPLAKLISAVCQAFFGTLAMFTGYSSFVANKGSPKLTAALIWATQLAWLPYITSMVGVGDGASKPPEENPFIPQAYNPSESDVHFVGAMGILAIMAHGAAYIGSLAFMEFSLYAYQVKKEMDRGAPYFRGRSKFYNCLLLLGGFTQFALGAYILDNFGGGALENGPIVVAMYTVFFPEISVFVGLLQMIVGGYGLARSFGVGIKGEMDNRFQILSFIMWLCMLSMDILVQVSYAPGGKMAAAAPTRACIIFGLAFMPAYLDVKMRCTPEELTSSYYGMSKVTNGEKASMNSSDEMSDEVPV